MFYPGHYRGCEEQDKQYRETVWCVGGGDRLAVKWLPLFLLAFFSLSPISTYWEHVSQPMIVSQVGSEVMPSALSTAVSSKPFLFFPFLFFIPGQSNGPSTVEKPVHFSTPIIISIQSGKAEQSLVGKIITLFVNLLSLSSKPTFSSLRWGSANHFCCIQTVAHQALTTRGARGAC